MISWAHPITWLLSTWTHCMCLELPLLWTGPWTSQTRKTCKKVQLDLQFFYFHYPIPSRWEIASCTKPGDGFQIKISLLFSLVCSWESLHIWYIYLPCIRLYLCSKLVLSLITAGSSTHRSVIFISSSKEWSSLNWEGKHREKQWQQ